MYDNSYTDNPSVIVRENINHMLSTAAAQPYVSFTAGAGYGKSTAAGSFLSSIDATVIWVALTPLDNDYVHLWDNVINSVRGVSQILADRLEKSGFPQDSAGIHGLILMLSQLIRPQKKCVLVLDDYHFITEKRIKNFFREIACANIHNLSLFVLSREDVSFLENQKKNTLVLTEKELAFSLKETREYFSLMNLNVSEDILFDIHYNKTCGWPFAIHLAAISLKNHPEIAEHSTSFSDKLIFETIDKEVFSRLLPDDQIFMLQLSLLDYYPKKLIEDVSDKMTRPIDLNTLTQNTFIHYNRHTETYQFHQMFRDFLQSKIHLLNNGERKNILSVCGDWYHRHDLIIDALSCYRRIDSYEKMWVLIASLFPDFISIGFAGMLLEIIEEFPETFLDTHPMVYQTIATLQLLSGDPESAVKKCHEFINILKRRPDSPENREAIGELYMAKGFAGMYTGDPSFYHCFKLAGKHLDGPSRYFEKPWLFILSGIPITLKDTKKGTLEAWTGTIEKTAPLFDKLLGDSMTGIGPLARATGYYYQNDLKTAELFTQKALYQGLSRNETDIACQSYYLLIRIAVGKGDYNAAIKYLNIINDYIVHKQIPSILNTADIAVAWFYAEIGLDECIPPRIADKTVYVSDIYIQAIGFERIIKAYCLLNDARYDELIGYLLAARDVYHKRRLHIGLIYSHVILSIAYYKTGQIEASIRAFHTAYMMSYDNDILLPFVEMRNHNRLLLSSIAKLKEAPPEDRDLQALISDIDDSWLSRVQKKAGTWTKMADTIRYKYLADNPTYDKEHVRLSKSEQEIMQYLSDGLTREEMADFMNISTNTVKSVIRSIYNKLGARNSAHAVHIALKKNLIS